MTKCEGCKKQKKADNCIACYKAEKAVGIANQRWAKEEIDKLNLTIKEIGKSRDESISRKDEALKVITTQYQEAEADLRECENDYAEKVEELKDLREVLKNDALMIRRLEMKLLAIKKVLLIRFFRKRKRTILEIINE